MRPRKFENPTVLSIVNGQATISPGHWEGDDGVSATGTVVSVRRVDPATPIPSWPVVYGATEIPPAKTRRPPGIMLKGFYDTDPIVLPPLPPGQYLLELWRGSATTDGNTPDSAPIYEWGNEASDSGRSNAVVAFTVPGVAPPPPPPQPTEAQLLKAARDAVRPLVRLVADREGWAKAKASKYGHAYYDDLGGK